MLYFSTWNNLLWDYGDSAFNSNIPHAVAQWVRLADSPDSVCKKQMPLAILRKRLEGWAHSGLAAILRDAPLRVAPQDEVGEKLAPRAGATLRPGCGKTTRLRQNNPTGRFPLSSSGKSVLGLPASRPRERGVGHRHERWDGMRWTRRHRARDGMAGRPLRARERSLGRADERGRSVR